MHRDRPLSPLTISTGTRLHVTVPRRAPASGWRQAARQRGRSRGWARRTGHSCPPSPPTREAEMSHTPHGTCPPSHQPLSGSLGQVGRGKTQHTNHSHSLPAIHCTPGHYPLRTIHIRYKEPPIPPSHRLAVSHFPYPPRTRRRVHTTENQPCAGPVTRRAHPRISLTASPIMPAS